MSFGAYLRFLRSALTALLICSVVILVAPVTESSRRVRPLPKGTDAEDIQEYLQQVDSIFRFSVVPRPEGLSPLGDFTPKRPSPAHRQGFVRTTLGWVDVGAPEAILNRLPRELRGSGQGKVEIAGKGRARPNAAMIVRLDPGAAKRLGYGQIETDIRAAGGEVLGVRPYNALIVKTGSQAAVRAVGSLQFVTAITDYEAAFKLSPRIGRKPVSNRVRAESRQIHLDIEMWPGPGFDRAAAAQKIRKIVGNDGVLAESLTGRSYRVRGDTNAVRALARLDDVMSVSESLDWVLMNSEIPTIIMIGSTAEGFPPDGARPYHDLGIDGGGIDTDGDDQRINNGTDAVPPQIVTVTDNGLSYDSTQFSQTLTQPITLAHPIGPTHRKVHSIQAVVDSGSTCDATLAGGNTHGNIVSGIIAGNPGAFGLMYSDSEDAVSFPEYTSFRLDGTAAGARILMQDAGGPDVCTLRGLDEMGGNVEPGFLIDRLNLSICPTDGNGAGACQGTIGGGDEVHLHVMPFGTPNFDVIVDNTSNGTYPLEAQQIDLFLVNNRDYMVFAPVGNQGQRSDDAGEARWPDLFNGTAIDDDPNDPPERLQVSPPSTAKNLVSVGAHFTDPTGGIAIGEGSSRGDPAPSYSSTGPATS